MNSITQLINNFGPTAIIDWTVITAAIIFPLIGIGMITYGVKNALKVERNVGIIIITFSLGVISLQPIYHVPSMKAPVDLVKVGDNYVCSDNDKLLVLNMSGVTDEISNTYEPTILVKSKYYLFAMSQQRSLVLARDHVEDVEPTSKDRTEVMINEILEEAVTDGINTNG